MTVARMKSAPSGFDEVGKTYARKVLVAGVALGLAATACGMPVTHQHQVTTYGPMPQVRYKDLIPRFKTEHFDPQAWANGHALIHSIGPTLKVTAVTLLATGKPVPFRQPPDGLHLDLPAQPAGVHAYAYRIGLDARGKDGRTTKDDIASGWCGEKSIKPSCSFVMGRKA